ncbi:MAG: acyltransferase family protein [Treponema sp.]|nr:acyltransferase family protein [Treponema sp.]
MEAGSGKKEYYPFLDGLKALACASVYLGHYFIAFCVKDIFPVNSPAYRLGEFIFSGSFAVTSFCLVSGFLAARKEIASLRSLVCRCTSRFLRFEVPIIVVIAAVMFANRQGLFYYGEALAPRLENKRILGQFTYETDFLSLFKKPFWAFWNYDNPLWMIGQLFIGGIMIYLRSYAITLLTRLPARPRREFLQLATFAPMALTAFIDTTIFAVILGAGLFELHHVLSKLPAGKKRMVQGLSAFLAGGALVVNCFLYFMRDYDYLSLGREYTWAGLAGAAATFCLVLSLAPLRKAYAHRPLPQLGNISFGIYVLHYPLLGIISCRFIYGFMDGLGYAWAVLASLAVTSALLAAAAVGFRFLIEKPAYRLIGKLEASTRGR